MTSRRVLLGAMGLLLVAPVRFADASQVLALTLGELTEQAPIIVVGQVMSVASDWEVGRKRILTTVQIEVEESWKGPLASKQIVTIVQPGGVAGDIQMKVHGMPRFAVGQRAVLFLGSRFELAEGTTVTGKDELAVVGMAQGQANLWKDTAQKKWMVKPPSRDGVVVRNADGLMVQAPAVQGVMSLDDMRTKIRTLVQAKTGSETGSK